MIKNKKILLSLFLAFVLILAFFVRVWNIDQVPAGIYPDEAVNGIDAYRVITGQQPFAWFYPDNQGREGLFMNLIILSFSVFGITVLGLKFWSILFGVLTVLGTYLLTKELYRSRKAGLIAAFLVAVSFWAVNFARISFRANMLPFILVYASYFLFLGLRLRKYWPFLAGGLIFGIGLHTYIAFRISPAIFIVLFLAVWASRTDFLKTYWRHTLVFIAGFMITAFPMFITFYQHPEYLGSRSSSISVFSPEVNHGHPWITLGKSIGLTLQQYNVVGDMNWRHNYPPYPLLHPFIGVSFLIGLIIVIKQFFALLYARIAKGAKNSHLEVTTLLLSWLVIMHAPEFLTFEGIPHALRAIGALPVVFIIATVPFIWLMNVYARRSHFNRVGAYLFIFAIVLSAGIFDMVKYHVFWANAPEQHRSFQANLMDIARFIPTIPKDTPVYFVTGNMERIPVKLFNTDRMNFTALSPNESETADFPDHSIIILTQPHTVLLGSLQKRYTFATPETKQDSPLNDAYFIIRLGEKMRR